MLFTPNIVSRSGFRIEVAPTTKLGKQLKSLSVYLRNRSDAVGPLTRKVWVSGPMIGFVSGKWTVRPSGAISFKGTSSVAGDIEYLYGRLTIGHFLDKPGHQVCLNRDKTVKFMSTIIQAMYPYVGSNLTEKDLNLKLTVGK